MTLLEIMVVLAIIGLMLILGVRTLMNVRASNLRAEANRVLAVLRLSYNGASATGQHVRTVFDLDQQKYWMEVCEGDVRMRARESNEDDADEDEENREKLADLGEKVQNLQEQLRQSGQSSDQLAQVLQATSPEKAIEAAAALEGVRIGDATCKETADPLLATRNQDEAVPVGRIDEDSGIHIRRIYVKHLEEPVEAGRVEVNFFPLGFAERAIVELVDEDNDVFSLKVHGTTGEVEIVAGEIEDPDDFMMRNALGDTEEKRGE